MALKSFINDSENNQAGDFNTLHTALISRAGVFDLSGGDLLVTGTAGKTVNIASGGGFVENSSYVNGTQDQKIFPFASNATESVTIDNNTSGNPRIDLICAKIDTAVSPGTRGVNSISFVAVKGTPGVSPARPSLPSNHLELGELAVPNGFTSTSGNLTDTRVQFQTDTQFVNYGLNYVEANTSSPYAAPGDDSINIVPINNKISDPNNLYNNSSYKLTIPRDAIWAFDIYSILIGLDNSKRGIFYFYVNNASGTQFFRVVRESDINAGTGTLENTIIRRLNAGDVVDIRVRQNRGTAIQTCDVTVNLKAYELRLV